MSTLTITIGIVAPVITFLIGRYFYAQELYSVMTERDDFRKRLAERIDSDYYSARKLELDNIDLRKEVIELYGLTSAVKQLQTDLDECETLLYGERARKHPKFELVANKDKHPAANDNYLYIEGDINGNREAGLLKLSDWSKAKERLLKNPEDKPNN
jgi:hypothetical protein